VVAQLVVHVKRGCSSGYMCLALKSMDDTLISAAHGLRSHHPEEACTHHYFSTKTTHLLVAETTSSPCPFSGSYTVQGRLLLGEEEDGCHTVMQAGCDNSHRLELQRQCHSGSSSTALVCHGLGVEDLGQNQSDSEPGLGAPASPRPQQQVLVVSEAENPKNYLCLAYTDVDNGRLESSLSAKKCDHIASANVSSSGPCILPLTQEGGETSSPSGNLVPSSSIFYLITPCLAFVSTYFI